MEDDEFLDPLGISIIIIVLVIIIEIYVSLNILAVRKYKYISSKIPESFDGVKIVHISDVHSRLLGKENKKLVTTLKKINPDYIFMTGDIIDKREENIPAFVESMKEILTKYPVYYCIGNHEKELGYCQYKSYLELLKKYHVNVLADDQQEIEREEEKINIFGLNFKDNFRYQKKDIQKLDKMLNYSKNRISDIDENKMNILLAHDPLNFELYEKLGFDLIFSGHVHGGIIRFFRIGLLSPRRKLFPKYCHGKYELGESTLIVSSGIGKATIPIRFGNQPEIGVITLKREKSGN